MNRNRSSGQDEADVFHLGAGLEYSTRSFVVSNPSRNEVWVCYPPVGETTCTRALIWELG